ncbi:acyl carrier protein [Salirhabdus sp. Marseille-P4669]|uniref:acyl carrier protein n=1 Tax=Salirhabdus sp. Marseille-P4669 TaxID=2042310 RepID=UPI000C7DCB5D|nr:phosphopantetheine-binding protein [Salirhabdus sp. Marseille-P4669]
MNFKQFVEMLSDFTNIPANTITKDAQFVDDLGVDSLNMVNLLIQISEATNVEFERFIKADSLKTVGSIYNIISQEERI